MLFLLGEISGDAFQPINNASDRLCEGTQKGRGGFCFGRTVFFVSFCFSSPLPLLPSPPPSSSPLVSACLWWRRVWYFVCKSRMSFSLIHSTSDYERQWGADRLQCRAGDRRRRLLAGIPQAPWQTGMRNGADSRALCSNGFGRKHFTSRRAVSPF